MQKDSRRPRFELTERDGRTELRQVRTHQGLITVMIILGYLCCVLPGIAGHLSVWGNRSYSNKVAGTLAVVLKAHYSKAD
jgi:hypothetical protein